nr:immunoglobulin heavy chain junction region [Macaca mulatta]
CARDVRGTGFDFR